MKKIFLFMLLCVASACAAGEVAVLTETPVAEFALPDGKVLKNAFVWRRNSEGLMIVHDDGQEFLNFKLLPADWRSAYGLDPSEAPANGKVERRHDQYLIYPILMKLKGLSPESYSFYTSKRYKGDADNLLLSGCALQSLLDENFSKALRLNEIVAERFPDDGRLELKDLFSVCERCKGEGIRTFACKACSGSGKCEKCGGKGTRAAALNDELVHCTFCRGSGKCPKCGGSGEQIVQCHECKGRGKILEQDKVNAQLAILVEELNAFQKAQ
ncbi:hypothetical protein [Pontiella sulfatireligans]|uniref:Chaperone protein DnaJ n=1 Tax=Pontiella sulfatireligans TaxID=2750658 RepID=A0A6C2ULD7_9BACT|nr:hypothetical protein [Pontiella sulfatireligans]VGO20918.1 hypothetical protein SCARR_02985 [Pontiella sulfatireligans]